MCNLIQCDSYDLFIQKASEYISPVTIDSCWRRTLSRKFKPEKIKALYEGIGIDPIYNEIVGNIYNDNYNTLGQKFIINPLVEAEKERHYELLKEIQCIEENFEL